MRGETVEEITGAVAAMRSKMIPVEAPADAIDIVGTGGDASGSYNISTLAAIIVAACGVPVAKHGNRAASSKSGTADVLLALGVRIGIDAEGVAACLREAGIGFMMAPFHHAAMRHVAPVRTDLGTRTVFNLLGPLCNPAGVRRHLLGVYAPAWLEPVARVLANLGSQRAWVVHGCDGLDELTTTGASDVVALADGVLTRFYVTPEDAGLRRADPAALKGGEPARNAEALRAVLGGTRNAYRDIAVLNAAASLVVAQRVPDLKQGAEAASVALDSGAAAATLHRLAETSNRAAAPANGRLVTAGG